MAKPKKQADLPKVASVELYLNECYPCHSKKYLSLYDWFLSLRIPLRNFQTNRIVLSREWLNFARKVKADAGIDPPFVVIYTEDGQRYIFAYQKFIEEGKEMFSKNEQDEIRNKILTKQVEVAEEVKEKRKVKIKKANIKKAEIISTDIEE